MRLANMETNCLENFQLVQISSNVPNKSDLSTYPNMKGC